MLDAGASLGPLLRTRRGDRMNQDSLAKARVLPIISGVPVESEMFQHMARVTSRLDFTVSERN